jgi:hypothetical protein
MATEKKTEKVETKEGTITGVQYEEFSRGMKAVVMMDETFRVVFTAWDNKDGKNPLEVANTRIEELGLKRGVVGVISYSERPGAVNPRTGQPYINRDLVDFKAATQQPTLAQSAATEKPAPAPIRTKDEIKNIIYVLQHEVLAACHKSLSEILGHPPVTDGELDVLKTTFGSTFIEISKRC